MSEFDSLDSLSPLDDPRTVTGVMQTPNPPLPAVPEHAVFQPTPPGLPAVQQQPQAPTQMGSQTLLTGEPDHDKIISAVSQIFQLRDDQARALQAAKEVEAEDANEKRKSRWGKIAIAVLTVLGGGGGGGAWYMNTKADAAITNEEAIRRHEIDKRLNTSEIKQNILQSDVEDVEKDLDTHMDEQRKENEADKLRSLRQEMMLETLLRSQGRRPPPKPEELKKAERAVGIDPDDPFDDG